MTPLEVVAHQKAFLDAQAAVSAIPAQYVLTAAGGWCAPSPAGVIPPRPKECGGCDHCEKCDEWALEVEQAWRKQRPDNYWARRHRRQEVAAQIVREGEIRRGDRLACGCTKNVLETGWHEFGCEIVGAHLCRQATKRNAAGTRSAAVSYST